jgi:hypothetical protein
MEPVPHSVHLSSGFEKFNLEVTPVVMRDSNYVLYQKVDKICHGSAFQIFYHVISLRFEMLEEHTTK